MKRPQVAGMKQFDSPITGLSADQLDRREFASLIAKAIRNLEVRGGSFTIGITGDWGEGKTSVMNMIVQWLLHDEMSDESSKGIYYSPVGIEWDHDQVTKAYEDYCLVADYADIQHLHNKALELSDVRWLCREFIKIVKDEAKAQVALQYFKLRHYCINHPRILVFRFSPWVVTRKEQIALNFVSELAKALKGRCGIDVDREIEAVRNRIATLLQLAGAAGDVYSGTGAGGLVAGLLAKYVNKGSGEVETLDDLLERLSIALLNAPGLKKILVIVDDLDRLSPEEAVEMLSVIKGVANLPKTVHLLGYSERELAKRIRCHLRIDGNSYLEKVVQQKFALSQITSEYLESIVFEGLQHQLPHPAQLEVDNFQNVRRYVVRNYVRTLRDAKRLNNSFLFSLSALSGLTFAPDLLVIETLKNCEPELYNWLRTSLNWQLEEANNYGSLNNSQAKEKYLVSQIEKLQLRNAIEFSLRALQYLLPDVGFRPNGYAYRIKTLSVDRPFHDLAHRANYFGMATSTSVWSKDDMVTTTSETVVQKLNRLLSEIGKEPPERQSKLRTKLLDEIDDLLERNEWDNRQTLLALNKLAPFLIRKVDFSAEWFMTDNIDRLRGMFVRVLARTPEAERAEIFYEALSNSSDVSLLCDVARRAFGDRDLEGKQNGEFSFGAEEEVIYETLLGRVEALASSGDIWNQAEPSRIFWFWRFAKGTEGPKILLQKSLSNENSRASVYELFLSKIMSSGRGLYERISKKSIESFLDPADLYNYALSDQQSRNVTIKSNAIRFIHAYNEYDASMD